MISHRTVTFAFLTLLTARVLLAHQYTQNPTTEMELTGGVHAVDQSDAAREVTARLQAAGSSVLNARSSPNGVKCDGITDDSTAINSVLGAASEITNGIVYFPASRRPCMVGGSLKVPGHVSLLAYPGTVTLKVVAGSTANPQLLSISNVSNVLIYGLTLDGNLSGLPALNNLNTVYSVNNVVFDHVTVQNSRGIGIVFSTNVRNSGIRDSVFSNLGNYWKTSGERSDQQQGVAFCCGTTLKTSSSQTDKSAVLTFESASPVSVGDLVLGTGVPLGTLVARITSGEVTMSDASTMLIPAGTQVTFASNVNNFVSDSLFSDTGLDAISLTDQRCAVASGNRCMQVGGRGEHGGACVYASGDVGLRIRKNTADGSFGNGIDVTRQAHEIIDDNVVNRTASRGIAVDNSIDVTLAGNHVLNSQTFTTNNGKGGINLSGTLDGINIVENESRDDQPIKTQPYGIAITRGSTVTNLFISPDNLLTGNSRGEILDDGGARLARRPVQSAQINCH